MYFNVCDYCYKDGDYGNNINEKLRIPIEDVGYMTWFVARKKHAKHIEDDGEEEENVILDDTRYLVYIIAQTLNVLNVCEIRYVKNGHKDKDAHVSDIVLYVVFLFIFDAQHPYVVCFERLYDDYEENKQEL